MARRDATFARFSLTAPVFLPRLIAPLHFPRGGQRG